MYRRSPRLYLLEDFDRSPLYDDFTDGYCYRRDPKKMQTSTFMNFLSGGLCRHGQIVVITSNAAPVKSALFRPGRIDLKAEVGNCDEDTMKRLISDYGLEIPKKLPEISISKLINGLGSGFVPEYVEEVKVEQSKNDKEKQRLRGLIAEYRREREWFNPETEKIKYEIEVLKCKINDIKIREYQKQLDALE